MFFDKKIKALELKEEADKQKHIQAREIEAFMRAFAGNSYFLCVKKLGVLEYIGVKDIAFFTGLTHMLGRNYDAAINMFQKISSTSKYYEMRTMYLLEIYRETGNYMELSKILNQGYLEGNVLGEIQTRLLCLWNSDSLWVNEHAEEIKKDMATTGEKIKIDNESGEMFFQVCNLFAELLLAAGEMINRVVEYKNMYPGVGVDLTCDTNVANHMASYEKYCTMLSLARYVGAITFVNEKISMEQCALADKSWDDKIRIFQNVEYHKQIIKIIDSLICSDIHNHVDRSRRIIRAMTLCSRINPQTRAEFIAQNFEEVKTAYLAGEHEAIQHVNYVYAEINITENDPYKLNDSLKNIVVGNIDESKEDVAFVRKVPRKAYVALRSAEATFELLSKQNVGTGDYSTLSLQYFRILEMVYSEKVLKPMAINVSISVLYEKAKEQKDRWDFDIKLLKKIKSEKQESAELGKIRVFLQHIREFSGEDKCAIYLEKQLRELLSDEGKREFRRGKVEDIISEEKLNLYRIPGAHIGYLPFSVACESRKYVLEMLPRVLSWFK